MRSSRCAFSTAAALRRVFIAPSGRPLYSQLRPQLRPPSVLKPTTNLFQHRAYASALPSDEEILTQEFLYVHLVDESGKLSKPMRVTDILDTLDRETQSLQTLALPPPRLRRRWERPELISSEEAFVEEGSESGNDARGVRRIPVCRIVNLQAVRGETKARAKKPRSNPALTVKMLELNWAIDPHDLGHRVKKLQDFLEKGYKVEVLLVGKRKKRKATPGEALETLRRIREGVEGVEGAKEWKAMEGNVGGQVLLYFEGKVKKDEV